MHLTEADLGAALDTAADNTQGAAARRHASECAVCRSALAEAQAEDREVGGLLRYLDHPVPALDLASIAARSGAPRGWPAVRIVRDAADDRGVRTGVGTSSGRATRIGVRRGIVALVCAAAAAAAAVPSSPVRRVVARMVASRSTSHGVATPALPASPSVMTPPLAALRGVAIVAGRRVEIAFRVPDVSGQLRIHPGTRDEVAVTATGDGAAYTVAAGRVAIDNRLASGLTYDIDLPVAVPGADLVIRVGDRIVFARRGMTVITPTPPSADGAYIIRMADDARRAP